MCGRCRYTLYTHIILRYLVILSEVSHTMTGSNKKKKHATRHAARQQQQLQQLAPQQQERQAMSEGGVHLNTPKPILHSPGSPQTSLQNVPPVKTPGTPELLQKAPSTTSPLALDLAFMSDASERPTDMSTDKPTNSLSTQPSEGPTDSPTDSPCDKLNMKSADIPSSSFTDSSSNSLVGSAETSPADSPSSYKPDPNTVAYQLTDVVCAAPCLLKILSSKDRAALAACNRQLRMFMRLRTKALCVRSTSSLYRILKTHWPQLSLIVLRDQRILGPVLPAPSHKMHVLAALYMSHSQSWHRCTAFIVAALSRPQQPISNEAYSDSALLSPSRATSAAASLQQGYMRADFSSHVAAAISFLRKAGTKLVDSMVLWQPVPGRDIAAEVMSINWPSLVNLDVSSAWLTTAGVKAVIEASLPLLDVLNIDGSYLQLDTRDSPMQWRCSALTELTLKHTGMSTVALRQLVEAPWLSLTKVVLSGNKLGAEHARHLVSAVMPELKQLELNNNRLDGAAGECIAKADWPKLEVLWLFNNCLDDAGVGHLSKGKWSELSSLMLEGNLCTCVTSFCSVRWPKLAMLVLDKELLCAATLAALDLASDVLCDRAVARNNETVYVSRRRKSGLEQHVWPALSEVEFVPVTVALNSLVR